MTWTLTLPYTKPPISLNDRWQTPAGRRAHSAKVQQVRADVVTLARAANIPALEAIHVTLHYRPRDNRRRDSDNLVGTLKPCVDAIVQAGVVPDDCAPYVDWSRPVIHPAIPGTAPSLWLVVEAVA